MSVWLCMPSKRDPVEANPILRVWRDRGYKIALMRDVVDDVIADLTYFSKPVFGCYPGYAASVNWLVRELISGEDRDDKASWFLCAGDDMLPDPHKGPEEIARECETHFLECWSDRLDESAVPWCPISAATAQTFGVMQPTGDDFGANPNYPDPKLRGPYCTRVAGSPWMGREFCRRINQGRGPLWPEYFHCGEDEELQAVAIKYGVFWQLPDLEHRHMHWGRPRAGEKMAPNSRMPEFLRKANSQEEWQKYKKLFAEREAVGFPGSEPIP